MDHLLGLWISLRARERGQGLVEYALIIALVAIVLVAALGVLNGKIGATFSSISASL